ncbi:GDSL-type esterase/lipase family protein [Pontibacter sp. G13]|uniref:GDSL-type esterase/lipase family protein n=1 Tax=Pontibacter sp. G13 TaxID=3074898 RepID=UPI00288AB437|nr:GDSL-type esterase/lipase family protein [Pontibacter sp. G13]WNJ20306.1 GDSL-type esterase/lipase family protein [Pontibacter sp. G13]
MNRFAIFACLLIWAWSLSHCRSDAVDPCADDGIAETATAILPLGDSRVEGNRPNYESYRYELWQRMIQTNSSVDFIGRRQDEAAYPIIGGRCFDNDHEGYGGATSGELLEIVRGFGADVDPDIVLLGIGGNDLLQGVTNVETIGDHISSIISLLRQRNDSVVIILEQIAPGTPSIMTVELTQRFDAFNASVPALADSLSSDASPIEVVDMATDWKVEYFADDVHYNEAGAQEAANRYFSATREFLGR